MGELKTWRLLKMKWITENVTATNLGDPNELRAQMPRQVRGFQRNVIQYPAACDAGRQFGKAFPFT
jgi:hypothetical protein